MKKIRSIILLVGIAAISLSLVPALSKARISQQTQPLASAPEVTGDSADISNLYDSLHLDTRGLPRNVFEMAIAGYKKLQSTGKISNNKLSIADFTQPSTRNRLYIIDLASRKLLFHTLVAHGKNSGELMASKFSNKAESNQSSLGFYVTAEKYLGKHGLSLRLDGLEKYNNKARERAIVMHAANYVSEDFARARGYIGRSWGCPAVSTGLNEPIINAIGNGSCLFIYGGQSDYLGETLVAAR